MSTTGGSCGSSGRPMCVQLLVDDGNNFWMLAALQTSASTQKDELGSQLSTRRHGDDSGSPQSSGRRWEGSGREVTRKPKSARTAAAEAWQRQGLFLNYVIVRTQLRCLWWCNLMRGSTTLTTQVSALRRHTIIVILYLLCLLLILKSFHSFLVVIF